MSRSRPGHVQESSSRRRCSPTGSRSWRRGGCAASARPSSSRRNPAALRLCLGCISALSRLCLGSVLAPSRLWLYLGSVSAPVSPPFLKGALRRRPHPQRDQGGAGRRRRRGAPRPSQAARGAQEGGSRRGAIFALRGLGLVPAARRRAAAAARRLRRRRGVSLGVTELSPKRLVGPLSELAVGVSLVARRGRPRRDLAEIQPRCGRGTAEIYRSVWPTSARRALRGSRAGGRPRASQGRGPAKAEGQPRRARG